MLIVQMFDMTIFLVIKMLIENQLSETILHGQKELKSNKQKLCPEKGHDMNVCFLQDTRRSFFWEQGMECPIKGQVMVSYGTWTKYNGHSVKKDSFLCGDINSIRTNKEITIVKMRTGVDLNKWCHLFLQFKISSIT